jgi:hypothetical protein
MFPFGHVPLRSRRADNSKERQAEMADFIFHDPTGRRERRARLGVGLLVSLAGLIVAGSSPRSPSRRGCRRSR